MSEQTTQQALNVQHMILNQLQEISHEVKLIPQILARLDALAAEQRRLEERDNAQQKQIDSLTTRMSEVAASLSIISNDVRDLRREYEQDSGELRSLSKTVQLIESVARDMDTYVDEVTTWRPWLSGFKWFVTIVGGVLVGGLATALLSLL